MTARTTSPFLTAAFGMACLTLAMMTSPTPASVLSERPITRMHWIVRAPVLSATLRRVWDWITRRPPRPSPRRVVARRRRRRASRPGWAAAWIASEVAASSVTTSPGRPWSPPRATIETRRQRLVADSGRDSSIRTVSPMRASLLLVVGLELRAQADDPLVEPVARQALDGHDDRLVHPVADDATDLGLPLALHCTWVSAPVIA